MADAERELRNKAAANPRGNKNAKKHGLSTREAILERQKFNEFVQQARKLILKVT